MRFSEALLRKVKQCDLTAYIRSVVPDIRFEPHGNYYTARCPHPDHDDEHPSFRVWHNRDGTWSFGCMSCHTGRKDTASQPGRRNYGTDIIAFIQWMSDHKGSAHIFTFEEAVIKALTYFHIPVPPKYETPVTAQERYFRQLAALYHRYFMLYESEQKAYWKTRGLNQQDAAAWQIGSDGDRLIFPLYNQDNRLCGFTGRTIRDEDPKYKHSSAKEGFIKGEFLYGIHKMDRSLHTACITEGAFDVITAYKYGIKNVLACLGTSFMESHAKLLAAQRIREVTFIFDGDEAGRKALNHAIQYARAAGLSVSLVLLPDGEDLDSFCRKQQYQSRQKLEAMKQYDYEYELGESTREYQSQRNILQNRYLRQILSKASQIKDDTEYAVFQTYILNQFDIRLEPRNVQKVKANMAHSLSAQIKAAAEASAKASA